MMPGVCGQARIQRRELVGQVVAARPLAGDVEERGRPRNVLPPDFGTRFITGPPMSLSPRPPPTVMADFLARWACRSTYDDTPPLRAAATVIAVDRHAALRRPPTSN